MSNEDALFEAIVNGDADRLREIVAADPSLAAARNAAGLSAVMVALYHRRADLVDALLEHSPPLDRFEAAALGRFDLIDRAIARGADWSETSVDGFTALHLAAYFGRTGVALRLIECGADVNAVATNDSRLRPLHAAASAAARDIVQGLLAAGADVNAPQEGGFTALHAAAHRGDADLCRILLDAGADRTLITTSGKTAREFVPPGASADVAALL